MNTTPALRSLLSISIGHFFYEGLADAESSLVVTAEGVVLIAVVYVGGNGVSRMLREE